MANHTEFEFLPSTSKAVPMNFWAFSSTLRTLEVQLIVSDQDKTPLCLQQALVPFFNPVVRFQYHKVATCKKSGEILLFAKLLYHLVVTIWLLFSNILKNWGEDRNGNMQISRGYSALVPGALHHPYQ